MSSVATIAAVGTVVAANENRRSAKDAANKQITAANSANELEKYMYEQNRDDMQPYREAGYNALEQMQSGNAAQIAQSDPGYQFRLSEGMKAMNANASATGNRLGGAQAKALSQYAQDYASNEYGNAWNRLSSLAGIGNSATTNTANMGQNYSNSVSNNYMNAANASAASQIAATNATNNAINSGTTLYTMYRTKNPLEE